MRTLVVSDLHLGSSSRSDVLRARAVRAALVEALREADRLVLLGDVLELRHGPSANALRAAEPVLRDLGAAMAGGEIVLLAGNHDHALVEGWLARRAEQLPRTPLEPEQRFAAEDASPLAATLARWLAPAEVSVAYPAVALRHDVHATHGHYLDCHITVPTMERLAIATMGRLLDRPPDSLRHVDDYEAVSAPVFAWIDAVAASGRTGSAFDGTMTMRMWRALEKDRGAPRPAAAGNGVAAAARPLAQDAKRALRRELVRRGFPLAIAALNRARLGPLEADVSSVGLRRAGLNAMAEVAARLRIGDGYVIFGHTHRAGPLDGDDPREWCRDAVKLVNAGSWVFSPDFVTDGAGATNPYWPGSCVIVDDSGPPQVRRLLLDRSREQLSAARS
ncbi:MAG: metallophosphoesterase [Solirubrobacteraceae bacterium]